MPRRELYTIEKSKLYRIGRKHDLAVLFELSLPEMKKLSSDDNYKEWAKKQKGKDPRIIEEPNKVLAPKHSHLHNLLASVETPSYLLSGKKGVKPQDNAEQHKNNAHMVTVDIKKFFPSVQRELVFRCFRDSFGHTSDVASLMADFVTYKGHVPTGSAVSQDLAFWAIKPFFDRIFKVCLAKNIHMTVWVDDLTFSSKDPLPQNWVKDIEKILSEASLELKHNKTKKYKASDYKVATGSAISPRGEIRVKNAKRKEIIDLIKGKRVKDLPLKETRTLVGKLVSQRQNEVDFFGVVYRQAKKRLRVLERRKFVK